MKFLRKEDGDLLLKEDGGSIIVQLTTLSPSTAIVGYDYEFYVQSEEGGFDGSTTALFSGSGITINSVAVINANRLRIRATIDAGAALTARDLTLTTGAVVETNPSILTLAAAGGETTLRNGFQYTLLTRGEDIRRQPGIVIRDVLNNQPNSCTFSVDGQSNAPLVGEKIEIRDSFDSDRLLFAGTVQSVTQEYEEQTTQLVWRVNCIDFTWLLNKYRPSGVYKNTPANLIVVDLIERFAPGFTTDFVQTKLSKVTANFDGTQDFSTCLNQLAEAIGGGHWYVDYNQAMHFFHVQPDLFLGNIPQPPGTVTPVGYPPGGPQTPVTVSEGAHFTSNTSFSIGFYAFRMTYVYDNGAESAMGPWSNIIPLQGSFTTNFSNVPIGPAVGSHSVVARRMYYTYIGPVGINPLGRFVQINDNVTTSFSVGLGVTEPSDSTLLTPISVTTPLPFIPIKTNPTGGTAPTAAQGTADIFWPQYPPLYGIHSPMSFTPGYYAFKVSYIYRDGTESLPSASTDAVYLDGIHSAYLSNIPIGPEINGVDVIGRKVYACYAGGGSTSTVTTGAKTLAQVVAELQAAVNNGTIHNAYGPAIGYADADSLASLGMVPSTYNGLGSIIGFADLDALMQGMTTTTTRPPTPKWDAASTSMWYLLYDNTTTAADIGPGTGGGTKPVGASEPGDEPSVWPNPDGPYLEDYDLPADVTDDNPDLLKDPMFTSTIDISQVRNRIFVRGAGTVTTEAAVAGATSVSVAETSLFSVGGGQAITGTQVFTYYGLTSKSGPGGLLLQEGLRKDIDEGDTISLYHMAESIESQKALAKVELDKDGLQTDGVHEYTIIDTSLTTPFQMYVRAQAELELFANPIVSIRYATRDSNTRSGAKVVVDMTNPPCKGEFLIQDVTIDQIHDESDQLFPRYTVSASSVKFDLSDLLLKIISGRIDGGTSFAGVQQASGDSDSTLSDFPKDREAWMFVTRGTLGTPIFATAGCSTSSGGTGTAPVFDSTEIPGWADPDQTVTNATWVTCTTTTVLSNSSAVQMTGGPGISLEEGFDLWFEIMTGKSLTNLTYYVGLWTTVFSTTNSAYCSLRYTSGTDTAWTIVMNTEGVGHTDYSVGTGVPVQANTRYIVRMQTYFPGGSNFLNLGVRFTVNGVSRLVNMEDTYQPPAVGNNSPYSMPSAGAAHSNGPTDMRPACGVIQRLSGGAARKLNFRRMYVTAP